MDNPEALIICSGYKDEDFIELALLAQKMGKNIFIVVEKMNELHLVVELSRRIELGLILVFVLNSLATVLVNGKIWRLSASLV